MSVEALRATLGSLTPINDREAASIAATLERLDWPQDPYDIEASDHHLTASSLVVSSRGVILHRHRLLGIWVQPGGHVDPGETPDVACVRETVEETGLLVAHLDPVTLFHVDQHPGPRGHTHYDLRYVLLAEPYDPSPGEGESSEVYWFDFAAAQARAEPELVPVLAKLAEFCAEWGVTDSNRD